MCSALYSRHLDQCPFSCLTAVGTRTRARCAFTQSISLSNIRTPSFAEEASPEAVETCCSGLDLDRNSLLRDCCPILRRAAIWKQLERKTAIWWS
jgi:hypothetical protein